MSLYKFFFLGQGAQNAQWRIYKRKNRSKDTLQNKQEILMVIKYTANLPACTYIT